jgi:eukaryotic-like serine/threonine-protein kinase
VRADGTVKVLDFGLAKAMDPVGVVSSSHSISPTITTPAMTAMGMILGTAAYMSPEQADNGKKDGVVNTLHHNPSADRAIG